ncbi:MAG: UvrB/UvrC motif-containing protein, partial [Melioribacteraceae bacterium]
ELLNINEFLCGHNQSAVDRLLNRMKELSAQQKFEEAAQIRDVVQSILNQINKASILAEPINKANVLIEVGGSVKNDYLILIDGKIVFKEYFIEEKNHFDDVLEDYFSGSIRSDKIIYDKDLEKLRIGLSWLSKNRDKIKVHYLKEYKSADELAVNFILK